MIRSKTRVLMLVVLMSIPSWESSAQEKTEPKKAIDKYVETILLHPPQRGHFLSEEELERLSPQTRKEVEKLFDEKHPLTLKEKLQKPIGVSLEEWDARNLQYHYMIGVVVVPDEEEEQAEGVTIRRVTEGSPALKSGLKDGDIILKVNETELTDVKSLMDAIEATEGREMTLQIRRGADANLVESVKVTPVERPKEVPATPATSPQDLKTVESWLNSVTKSHAGVSGFHAIHPQLQMLSCQQCHSGVSRIQTFYPGVVIGLTDLKLPENLKITITRQGTQPASVTVKRDEQSWEVTEHELNKLPADIRPHVERMLGRHNQSPFFALPGVRQLPNSGIYTLPQTKYPESPKVEYKVVPHTEYKVVPETKSGQTANPQPGREEEKIGDQLKQLQKQLEELQKSVEKLQKEN